MKLKLKIINTKDVITWELWGNGIGIIRYYEYSFIGNAVKAAKQVAKKLNIVITSCIYYEPEFSYEQSMRI